MQVLHKYMFYLIYGYEGEMNKDQAQARAQLRSLTTAAEDVEPEMSQIYNSSALDYKTFLPPLPEHSGQYFVMAVEFMTNLRYLWCR